MIERFLANITLMGLCGTCTHTPSDIRFITYKEKGSSQSTWIGGVCVNMVTYGPDLASWLPLCAQLYRYSL